MTTRREFIGKTSQAAAGVALASGGLHRTVIPVFPWMLRGGTTAATLFPHEMAPFDLSAVALQALDAAKSAGAAFADIRVTQRFQIERVNDGPLPTLSADFGFGLRVIVDGATAFVHGCVPDPDRLAAAARDAVAAARGFGAIKKKAVELAPAPVVQGEWTTPIHGDPFKMPLNDQIDLLRGYEAIGERVTGAQFGEMHVAVMFNWTKELRVFASTEGSLVHQTVYLSAPEFWGSGDRSYLGYAQSFLSHLGEPRAGGYETVFNTELPERLQRITENAQAASRLPIRSFDVGKYPVVIDGGVVGLIFGQTVGLGLELDRVLGDEAGVTGSSYLAPPEATLGKTMINPLLNVSATRAMPHFQAVKWDDDGVEPIDYTVLKDGVVVDYATTRETAPALAAWYQSQGRPMRSNGCSMVGTMLHSTPMVAMPHLDVDAGKGSASAEDLYRDIPRGLYVAQRPYLSVDQQHSTGQLEAEGAFEISHGKIVGRVKDVALEFKTADFWKSLLALGDATTVQDTNFESVKSLPHHRTIHTMSAPAALFKDIHVLNTGRNPRYVG